MNFAIYNSKISLSCKIFKGLYKVYIGIQSVRLWRFIIQTILFWTTWTFCNRLFAAIPHARIPYLRRE